MKDEGKLRQDQDRGNRAKKLLENDLLIESFDSVEQQFIDKWKETGFKEADVREDAWRCYQLLRMIRGNLDKILQNGRVAEKDLEYIHGSKLKKLLS